MNLERALATSQFINVRQEINEQKLLLIMITIEFSCSTEVYPDTI